MERLETPERYVRFLAEHGGRNPFGEPNFILAWGQTPIHRYAVPDQFLAPYLNCWCFAEWAPPEDFGSRWTWNESAWGPFPVKGAYVPLQIFKDGDEPVMLDTERLNIEVLRLFLWVVVNHKHDSLQKRKDFLKDEFAKKKAEEQRLLIERIEDGAPAFIDAVSFHGQLNKNAYIKQKMEQLEQNLDRITDVARRFPRGMTQGEAHA